MIDMGNDGHVPDVGRSVYKKVYQPKSSSLSLRSVPKFLRTHELPDLPYSELFRASECMQTM